MRSDTPDYEVTSTAKPLHSIAMSLDMESLGDLFDVLSGLYSDQELAIIRELSTNARDSHIEAGVTRPIEVTLPTVLEPTLSIQDFGLGMSRTEIEETYSKYGASTKRDSDDYNGTLGLGSKSPLTYTPQFTFIGVKDGVKTIVSVSKSETVPVMKVLSESPTDECNGVKVIIPAKSYNYFKIKAQNLFRFWDPDTVLIDGEKPTKIEGLNVTDDILVTRDTDSQSYIVMAGVPYPVSFNHSLINGYALIAYVPTGNVSFVPSREALKYTTKTREAIASILAEYEREAPNAVQDQIEGAENARLAFQALAEWRRALGTRTLAKMDFNYKGKAIPVEFAPKGERFTVSSPTSSKLSACSRESAIGIETVVQALCVYGYDLNFTPSHKKKLNKYVEDNGIKGVGHYVLAPSKLPMHWLDPARVVDWEVIRAIKLPRSGRYSTIDPNRIPGSYDICEQGDWNDGVPGEDIDQTSPIYYINTTHYNEEYRVGKILSKHKKGFTLVKLTSNRVPKFCRLFPKAEPVHNELKRIVSRIEKKITDEERFAWNVQTDPYLVRAIKKVDLSRLDDPAFADIASALDLDLKESAIHKLDAFKHLVAIPTKAGKEPDDPFENYPLVTSSDFSYNYSSTKLDEMYLYMNASYHNRIAKSEEQDNAA